MFSIIIHTLENIHTNPKTTPVAKKRTITDLLGTAKREGKILITSKAMLDNIILTLKVLLNNNITENHAQTIRTLIHSLYKIDNTSKFEVIINLIMHEQIASNPEVVGSIS